MMDLYLEALNDIHYFHFLDADILFIVGGAFILI